MALFYKYFFTLKNDGVEKEVVLYAESEVKAKEQFLETFGKEAPALNRRENW